MSKKLAENPAKGKELQVDPLQYYTKENYQIVRLFCIPSDTKCCLSIQIYSKDVLEKDHLTAYSAGLNQEVITGMVIFLFQATSYHVLNPLTNQPVAHNKVLG